MSKKKDLGILKCGLKNTKCVGGHGTNIQCCMAL